MTLPSNDEKKEKPEISKSGGSWTRLLQPGSGTPDILKDSNTPPNYKPDHESASQLAENTPVIELPVLKPGDIILGTYQVKEVFSGGMGHVYIAAHKFWHRKIAIKSPNMAVLAKKSMFARILREANAWIEMGLHPNIAYCYYVKKIEQVPHIMVEYADNGNLRHWIGRHVKKQETDYRQALNLAIQFCHGMAFANSAGMIHRDIKPENILLTKSGILKITDFGLVRKTENIPEPDEEITLEDHNRDFECFTEPLLTRLGVIMGTPPYISPEQRKNAHDVDKRTDIYSFGVCLFEMFCKCRPDIQNSRKMPCPAVLSKDKNFPRKLSDLIIKCVQLDADKRYTDFYELARELSEIYEEIFNEQSPFASLEILPPAADGLNNKGVSFLELDRFKEAKACFVKAVSEDNFHAQANWNIGNFRMLSNSLILDEHQDETIEMLRAVLQESGLSEEKIETRIQYAIETKDFLQAVATPLPGLEAGASDIAFSPCSSIAAVASSNNSISIWSSETGKKLNTLTGHTNSVNSVLFFPKGDILVSGSTDKTIRIWDYETGQELDILKGHTGLVSDLAFSPCGNYLASAGQDKTVRIWNPKTGELIKTLEDHEYSVNTLCFSKNGTWLASAGNDRNIILRDTQNFEPILKLKGHEKDIFSLAFSPDSSIIASGSRDNTIKLWNPETGALLSTVYGHKHWVTCLEFSPDNRFLISAGRDYTIRVWDAKTGRHIKTLEGHNQEVSCIAFSSDSRFLASGSWDKKVNIWNANVLNPQLTLPQDYVSLKKRFAKKQEKLSHINKLISGKRYQDAYEKILESWNNEGFGSQSDYYDLFLELRSKGEVSGIKDITPFHRIAGHADNINALCFSSDSEMIVSASSDKTAKVWSTATGKPVMQTEPMPLPVFSAVFSPDAKLIAAGSDQVYLWDIKSKNIVKTLFTHTKEISALAFSPDSRYLATGSSDQTVIIWDLNNNYNPKHILEDLGQRIDSISFSKDSRLIAAGTGPIVRLWEIETGKLLKELTGHKLFQTPVKFSPDGKVLASVKNDNSIIIWDIPERAISDDKNLAASAQSFETHSNDITSLDFSPDSRFLISGSADHKVKIWNLENKTLHKTLEGHAAHVGSVAFSPDNGFIASGSRDNSIRLWLIIPELDFEQDMLVSLFSKKHDLAFLENLIAQKRYKTAFNILIQLWNREHEKEKCRLLPVFETLISKCRKTGVNRLLPFKTLKAHTSYVESVCFSHDSRFLASAGWDKTIRIWDMQTFTLEKTLKWHVSHVKSIVFSPDNKVLASASKDSSIVIWDFRQKKLIKILEGHQGRIYSVSFLQNSNILVSAGEDNTIKFWDIETGKIIKDLNGRNSNINAMAFSPKDSFLAIGDDTGKLRSISLKGKKETRTLKSDKGRVNAAAFSPDESLLASGWTDNRIRVWEVKTGRLLYSWQKHTREVRTIVFSHDNELLASGGDDNMINIWDMKKASIIQTIDTHIKSITSITFSPDNRFMVSGSEDNTVRVWFIVPGMGFLDT